MRTLKALLTAACLAFGLAGAAMAEGNGTASGLFLRLPPSAPQAGMGEAGSAVAAGSPAIFVNPAGLAGVKGGYAAFSHSAWADSLTYNAVSAALRTRSGGVAGLGLRYLSYGNMEALDNTGAPAGSMAPRDLALDGAWAMDIGGGRSAGVSVKYISSRIKRSASAFAFDAGLMQRSGGVMLGAAVQNAGSGLQYGDEEYPLPLNLKLGAGVPVTGGLLAVFDLNVPRGASPWLAAGGKYVHYLNEGLGLALRAGYNTAAADAGGVSGLAAGFGLFSRDAAFDYSVKSLGELGLTHHFGLSFKWDLVRYETVSPYGPAPKRPVRRAR